MEMGVFDLLLHYFTWLCSVVLMTSNPCAISYWDLTSPNFAVWFMVYGSKTEKQRMLHDMLEHRILSRKSILEKRNMPRSVSVDSWSLFAFCTNMFFFSFDFAWDRMRITSYTAMCSLVLEFRSSFCAEPFTLLVFPSLFGRSPKANVDALGLEMWMF